MFKLLCRTRIKGVCGFKQLCNSPDFSKNRYDVSRGDYNYLQEFHIGFFRDLLGERGLLMDLSDLEKFNVDWYKKFRGLSALVLRPTTTEEVSKILQFCNEQKLAVCTQGGNTGVCGGSVPVHDEVIVSTELMNKIISLDETSGVLVCQSGCILGDLDNYLAERKLMVPLDLGAKGSCHIGGNVSTNAGGLRLLRYGNMHANVLGLEIVKANGEVLDCLSTLKKDNTGYHLKHLFIGSEGTLGFVTKVAIQCPPRPTSIHVAFVGLQNYEKVLKTFKKARSDLGEILSAVEVIDSASMEYINEKLHMVSPIGEYPFYLLIETSGTNEAHDSDKLNMFLESALDSHLILNGTLASEPSKVQGLWDIREKIPHAFPKEKHIFFYDFSLPLENYFTIVDEMRDYMEEKATRVFAYGHLGDGNVHLQITMDHLDAEIKSYLEPYIYKRVLELKGSISAEHGMGFTKGKYLDIVKTPQYSTIMKTLKQQLDPNGILNPYKVFPIK